MTRLWTEIWSRPGDASFGRVIDDPRESEGSFHDGLNQIGDGTLRIPNRFTGFDSILKSDPDTPANSVSSLVRVFSEKDPDTPIFEWLPGNLYPATSKEDPTVEVAGKGIKSILSYARLEPYDWDGSDDFVPKVPDWSFGGTQILANGGFETVPFPNGGFEDGNNDYWQLTQADGFLTSATSIIAVNDPVNAQAGDWYGQVNPTGAKSGSSRTFAGLVAGATYTITGFMKDPTASGDRWRAGVSGATTASHTNAYEEDGYWWAEVGNAAMGAGASTGAWQSFTLTFAAAAESIQLVIIFDDAGSGPDFWIDSWDMSGDGVGVYPWVPRYPTNTNVFEYQTSVVHSGTGALEVQGNDSAYTSPSGATGFGRIGAQQPLVLKVGSPYSGSVWVRQDSGSNQTFVAKIIRQSPLGAAGSPGSSDMANIVQIVATGTWTQLTIPTFIADVSEVWFYVSWMYTGAYDTLLHASPTYYIDDALLFEGLPETTFGDIFTQIYEHAVNPDLRTPIVWDDGSATDTPYLTLDYDATLDSAGAAWADAEISIKLTMRMSYSQIMAEFARGYGYEYRIVPDDVELGTWKMQAYNPGTMSTDYTAAASPAIQGGSSDVRRSIRRFVPGGTDTLVEGLGRVTGRARDAGLVTALGRIESARISREAPDLTAAADAADASIAAALTGSEALSYVLAGTLQDEPLSDYIIGDLLTVEDPPEVSASGRLVDVVCSYTPSVVEWETQFGSAIIVNPQAVVANAVAGLLGKFEYPFPEGGGAATAGEGAGGESTLLVAASDAPSSSITKADYLCTGTLDHEVIMAAMLEIYSAGGGRLRLSPGTFNIDADTVIVGYSIAYQLPIIMQGEGDATILHINNTVSSWGIYVTPLSRVRDIKIEGGSPV